MNPTRTERGDVYVYGSAAEVARAAADAFVACVAGVLADRATARVALAGGSTPKAMYRLLASPAYRERVEWKRVEIYFGDERCVPPEHAESNYRMAREALLDHVPLGADRVHRIAGERPPEEAAAQYQQKLVRLGDPPRLDLVLLGMGPDGHTASLFPNDPALDETARWVVGVPKANVAPFVPRVTLTLPTLASCREMLFEVAGTDKRAILTRLFAAENLPANRARSIGETVWLVDRAALPEKSGGQ